MGRTTYKVGAELSHTQVVSPDMPIHGACKDVRVADMESLNGIAGFLKRLDRLAVLRPVFR